MKEIIIRGRILDDKIATMLQHRGFTNKSNDWGTLDELETLESVLVCIGLLENMKSQLLNRFQDLTKRKL